MTNSICHIHNQQCADCFFYVTKMTSDKKRSFLLFNTNSVILHTYFLQFRSNKSCWRTSLFATADFSLSCRKTVKHVTSLHWQEEFHWSSQQSGLYVAYNGFDTPVLDYKKKTPITQVSCTTDWFSGNLFFYFSLLHFIIYPLNVSTDFYRNR